ncbi:MAG TPA: M13 family metallopeptidase [Pyrinomonadaceae bacterium]|nr:M13 family metallopeptidase [Pyrinomonadaceae bacterium]
MSIFNRAACAGVIFSFCLSAFAQSGFDLRRMDSSVDACDDFYRHANGGWLKTAEIPAAFPSWGTWDILGTHLREVSRDLLQDAMKDTGAAKGTSAQLIGDFYASCMDEAAIEAAGAKPLDPYFKRIDAIHDVESLKDEMAKLGRVGVQAAFAVQAYPDQKDSTTNIANAFQGGLSLPNSDYYTKTDAKSQELRDKFVAHLARMFGLLGDDAATAKANADTVMKLEMRFAKASKNPVELRDPANYYNLMTVAQADKLMPGFSWDKYGAALGTPKFTKISIGEPDFFKEAAKMINEVPLAEWKTYLRWNLINAAASNLSKKFDDANFDFFSKTLNGVTEQLPRWRRCTRDTDNSLGEALGEEFVKKNFSPAAKKRMDELIDNLFAAYREHINKVDWMSDATRKQALIKLEAIKRKIGYPSKLRGYAGLQIDRKSYFDNSVRIGEFLTVRNLKDIGTPLDPTRWGMTAATLNASYNPNFNDITFPAGILQPPFFDFKADDAVNYGSIGIVIGHEMTHGFDDQGSQYDAAGNLKMWWTADDKKKFDEKANCVTKQFNGYEVSPGLNINGELTLGENLADLGGMAIAYDAFKKAMEGKPRPANIDGMTPEQRFFLGWAQVWAEKDRPEYERLIVQSDPHSLSAFRVNGPLSNFPQFAEAYQCKTGSKMVRDDRCKVW